MHQSPDEDKKNRNEKVYGTILYDGTCGACSTFIGDYSRFFARYRFAVAPLQDPAIQSLLPFTEEELAGEIRLLLPDGSLIGGPNVYRFLFSKIWWLGPLLFLSKLPGLAALFDAAYRLVGRNRHKISKACRLQDRAKLR